MCVLGKTYSRRHHVRRALARDTRGEVVLDLDTALVAHQGNRGGALGLAQLGAGLGDEGRCLFSRPALVRELSPGTRVGPRNDGQDSCGVDARLGP